MKHFNMEVMKKFFLVLGFFTINLGCVLYESSDLIELRKKGWMVWEGVEQSCLESDCGVLRSQNPWEFGVYGSEE